MDSLAHIIEHFYLNQKKIYILNSLKMFMETNLVTMVQIVQLFLG